jgi:hypothetical protein
MSVQTNLSKNLSVYGPFNRCVFYIFIVLGLLCHCDICANTNDTCDTDGYCFASTSLQEDTGVVTYSYRCVIVIFCKTHLLFENTVKVE